MNNWEGWSHFLGSFFRILCFNAISHAAFRPALCVFRGSFVKTNSWRCRNVWKLKKSLICKLWIFNIIYFCSMWNKALHGTFQAVFYTLWAVIVLFSLLLLSKSDLGLANVIISMLILKARRRVVLFPKLLCQVRCEQRRHYCSILRIALQKLCHVTIRLWFLLGQVPRMVCKVRWGERRRWITEAIFLHFPLDRSAEIENDSFCLLSEYAKKSTDCPKKIWVHWSKRKSISRWFLSQNAILYSVLQSRISLGVFSNICSDWVFDNNR